MLAGATVARRSRRTPLRRDGGARTAQLEREPGGHDGGRGEQEPRSHAAFILAPWRSVSSPGFEKKLSVPGRIPPRREPARAVVPEIGPFVPRPSPASRLPTARPGF